MHSNDRKPLGTVFMPAVLCALTGTILSVSFEFMGYYSAPTLAIRELWAAEPFYLVEPSELMRELNWLVSFLFSLLVAVLTLGSASTWRRLLVGLMFLSLLMAFSPTLMLWGILWVPIVASVAFIWTWGCALIYGSQHAMPSDVLGPVVDDVQLKVETIPFPVKKNVK